MFTRTGSARYEGFGKEGRGHVSTQSGVLADQPYSFNTRFGEEAGTNPEELIAAAHAACFGMALSNELSSRGHTPDRLQIEATCSFEDGKVTTMVLDVTAEVPGVDEDGFREGLSAAEESCPVSNALRGNVDISVEAQLL